MLTNEQLAELRALAEKATQKYWNGATHSAVYAEYHNAANPDTMIYLLDMLRKRNNAITEMADNIHNNCPPGRGGDNCESIGCADCWRDWAGVKE